MTASVTAGPGEQGLTRGLAALAAGARTLAIPPEALAAARWAVIDTVGVMLAGRREPPVALLSGCLADGADATSFATGRRLRAADAALLDGLAGHVLDYDDVAQHGHPSVVIVPALLAEAQRIGASGEALLRAYVVGYECWAELAAREPDAFHIGSWHPTPVLGVMAATVALAALHRLEAPVACNALALAASFASGVIANFGTHAKPLQAGRAAANAVEAVRLAGAGLTGSPDAVEGPHGLLAGISPFRQVDTTSPMRAGKGDWALLDQGLSVKSYPVCYASHRAIDGVLDLTARAALKPEDVRSVTVALGPAPAATLRYHHPKDGLEARFSLHHNVAAALVAGQVGFAQLDDAFVRRPDVAALYPVTTMETAGEECPDQPGMAKFDHVLIETRDGRRLDSGPIRHPRGHAGLPLSETEREAKFLDCARHGGVADPDRLLDGLRALDRAAYLRALAQ